MEKYAKKNFFLLTEYKGKSKLFSKQTTEEQGSLLKGVSTLKSARSGLGSRRRISEGPPVPGILSPW